MRDRQAVVPAERAGAAAGVALTALVTMAGVGVAVSSTVLETLHGSGMPTARAISVILVALAAVLAVASAAVLMLRQPEPKYALDV
ncbi:MAG TPA: hypothetical protein VFW21_14980 [Mycobacterium sp.]|nr:hypothetical protein [Mycobacterium sp.]